MRARKTPRESRSRPREAPASRARPRRMRPAHWQDNGWRTDRVRARSGATIAVRTPAGCPSRHPHGARAVAGRESSAIGYRGHGVQARGGVEAITLPLGLPSTIQRATESKRTSNQAPAGPAQEQLARLLGTPVSIAAAPVLVGGQVVAV